MRLVVHENLGDARSSWEELRRVSRVHHTRRLGTHEQKVPPFSKLDEPLAVPVELFEKVVEHLAVDLNPCALARFLDLLLAQAHVAIDVQFDKEPPQFVLLFLGVALERRPLQLRVGDDGARAHAATIPAALAPELSRVDLAILLPSLLVVLRLHLGLVARRPRYRYRVEQESQLAPPVRCPLGRTELGQALELGRWYW